MRNLLYNNWFIGWALAGWYECSCLSFVDVLLLIFSLLLDQINRLVSMESHALHETQLLCLFFFFRKLELIIAV
jgi:hypothetical protein